MLIANNFNLETNVNRKSLVDAHLGFHFDDAKKNIFYFTAKRCKLIIYVLIICCIQYAKKMRTEKNKSFSTHFLLLYMPKVLLHYSC
ncbi:hypothetical protein HKQ48_01780 [Bacteroides vulgatus]|uniref:Uncharacterized protein n=2 Tax=Bacteroidaceae TaxID=815 RepID=A6L2N9_PHOV8|nr:hypothetical protein BVU_2294 [Phocaeicola vulgatus ATCC 8482]EEF89137.1 hypothetical protein BACCELL_03295 [Bacteroides cellulosilyticus DSM 14838]NMW50496.1 hypothetical protein [Phocaeicola vulgatus]OUP94965.1 hypothetical protein B5F00_03615 [Phocaeicola dorei]PQL46691.1 hypothetical protein C5Z04_18610 [Phocaeicola vulgatus]